MCTLRIARRPSSSGRPTLTTRSNRPGRVSASSSTANRLVAAMTMTPSLDVSRPSIQASSWFNVCSASELSRKPSPEFLLLPIASSSSTNMMLAVDLDLVASLKSCLTRAAPLPTNISTKSEPLQKKNGTWASAATALARRVFPVPGGPTKRMPDGSRAPTATYRSGNLSISTISLTSALDDDMPATPSKPLPGGKAPDATFFPAPPPIFVKVLE
mmetsp:Transcript_58106/g.79199  ORF Transcript_58106/g.79199 Transcript_58106/m.79199 type:complete len:215 (-) Transcript_58106:968-1612(-)